MFTRRHFIKSVAASSGLLSLGNSAVLGSIAVTGKDISHLPTGSAPAPVPFPHFPDRLHAFVWRNWQLVPVERMARVVGARNGDIFQIGRAMGLGHPLKITRDQQARSKLTVIRRNWHLLPYDQLLDLLDWSPEEMDYALREDDFLFIKLGSLKPKCEPLRYRPPTPATIKRQLEIAKIVREEFPDGIAGASDPLFGFVSDLSKSSAGLSPSNSVNSSLRFCYSYFALYGDPLLKPDPDPYPDGYLERLAQSGVNGVWLQAVLRKLAPFPWAPENAEDRITRLNNLRSLVARAARYGIRVFLYLNEPRAMPNQFFEKHPDLRGTGEGDYSALCTSAPEVQKFLTDSVASICKAVPDLGGFFTITASENLTNCWSHGGGGKCSRCGGRSAAEVIAEVNSLFAEGIRKSASKARLIAWDWGWNDGWAGEAIAKLPREAEFMSVSEWRLPIERGGVKSEIGEYSISAIGPGPRATRHWKLAQDRGLKTIAKIQAGNTWELSTVPYIPALENVAKHAANLRDSGVSGLMLGWTLGGYPSPNLEVISEAMARSSADEAMRHVADRRFGATLSPSVVKAWREFSAAFCEYPYNGGVLYNAPQQLGPANLLWAEPTGYHATMTGIPYDDLDGWRAIYSPNIFIQQFEKMADGFDAALERLKREAASAPATATPVQRENFAGECRVAEACAIHFRSVANQARFVQARRALIAVKDPADAAPQQEILKRVLASEIELARRMHRLQCEDSRFGFEASNQYFYVPMDLAEKVLNCRHLLERIT